MHLVTSRIGMSRSNIRWAEFKNERLQDLAADTNASLGQSTLPLSKSYWIVSPKATASLPKLVAFREWLLAQANDDTRRLDFVVGPPVRQRRNAGRKITSPASAGARNKAGG